MLGLIILACVVLSVAAFVWARAQGLIGPDPRAGVWLMAAAAAVGGAWAWIRRRVHHRPLITDQLEDEAQTREVIDARRAEVRGELDAVIADLEDEVKAIDAAAAPADNLDELAADLNDAFGGDT